MGSKIGVKEMPSNLTVEERLGYYAAEAMNGLVAGMPGRLTKDANEIAERAFEIAAAMMDEDERQRKIISQPMDRGN